MSLTETLQVVREVVAVAKQGEAWAWQHPLVAGGALVGSVALSHYVSRRFGRGRAPTSHGAGRWATASEIARAGLYARRGLVLGRHGLRWLLDDSDTHMLLCGPTGSQKDRRHLWPTTRHWQGSMVIVDVKQRGENLQHCGQARAAKGPVWVFAPTMRHSCNYNLLDWVRWGQPEAHGDVTAIVDAMMAPVRRQTRGDTTGDFFLSRGRTVLRAATLHVGHHEARRSFGGVLHFLSDRAGALKAMSQSRLAQVRDVGREYSLLTGDELNGVWSNTTNPLDAYRHPLIAAHTETSDFNFLQFQQGEQPSTLYLVAQSPMELPLLHAILRPVLVQGLSRLQAAWEVPRWPLLWLLNEFPAFGYMAPFEQAAPVIRGNAMRLLVVAQDLGQLFRTYGDDTPLWSMMAAKVFHTPNNDTTAERISRMLGETTVEWTSRSRQGWRWQSTITTHQGRRWLLDTAEVMGRPRHRVIIRHERCPYPIDGKKLRRWQAAA
jgi:type IV secretion system protein VirD4